MFTLKKLVLDMNTKSSVVNGEHKAFIAECVKRQNAKKFTTIKTVVFQSICILAVFAICIAIIGITLHVASYYQAKKDIETQAIIQQLEKGEVVEMKARVGGAE